MAVALLVVSGVLAACSSGGDDDDTATVDSSPRPTTSTASTEPGETVPGDTTPPPVETVPGQPPPPVTAVRGSACGYFVNVGLFGGPQNLRGCGQTTGTEANASAEVSLPPEGSAEAITAFDADGAVAQYGPARIFAGRWPEDVGAAPPSGPTTVSTQGTLGDGGSVKSTVEITLDGAPGSETPDDGPGGFGPFPEEGDTLRAECTATASGVTGSTTFVNAEHANSADPEGTPTGIERVPDNPPVNYTLHGVITNVGDVFTTVYNEHIINPDGSLTVNALHMYLFGPTAVGEMVKGQVTCGTTPTAAGPNDTVAPTCGLPVVEPKGPQDPTPKAPRTHLIGVFDAGGLQGVSNLRVENGVESIGKLGSGQAYLEFRPGQTGPVQISFIRTDDAEGADLPMTWSFDITDGAGNRSHCASP